MKKNIISISIGILFSLLFIFIKNMYFGKIPKNYGISGAVSMNTIDYLFLGSSCFRQGIDIETLEKEGFENTFLLAYNGNEPVYEIAELRYLIKSGVKINNIYMDMNPFIAQNEPSLSDVRILQDLDIETKLFLWNTINSKEFDISKFYEFWVQANNEFFATYFIAAPFVNSRYYKGGATDYKSGTSLEKLAIEVKNISLNELNYKQLEGIRLINQLCLDNDIRLCFIEPLIYQGLQENKLYQQRITEYKDFLDEEKISYIFNEEMNINFSDSSLYTNCNHASSKGREVFAKALAQLINE